MTLWTLATCMSNATNVIGERADISLSRCSHWANVAALDVQQAIEPQQMEAIAISSTTSGENKITLPTDFYSALDVSNLSQTPPYLLSKWNVYDVDSNMTDQGMPTNYVMYSTWMELWPSPDSSYSIQLRYQARPSVLTATTATPSFDTRFGIAWLYRTAEYLADSVKDFETAAVYRQKYLSALATIPSDTALRQRDKNANNIRFSTRPLYARTLDFDRRIGAGDSLFGP